MHGSYIDMILYHSTDTQRYIAICLYYTNNDTVLFSVIDCEKEGARGYYIYIFLAPSYYLIQ